METIDRYIYAVTQKLPQDQREDIAKELRSLIEDMLEERSSNRDATDKDVEQVLTELGNPRLLAQKYQGTKKHLIGPEYFDVFMFVLKIVLLTTAVSLGIVFVMEVILEPSLTLDHFTGLIVSFFTVIPMAIGWTVFGFALAERFNGIDPKDLQINKEWNVSELPPIPNKRNQIKRGETLTGIIIYVVFLFIFALSSEYFGVWVFQDGFSRVVPFLNEEATGSYLFLFIILIVGFGIIKESLKLVFGKWTKKLVIYTAIVNLLTLITFYLLINASVFWNQDFMLELAQAGVVTKGSEFYEMISGIWNASTMWILIVLIVVLIWDALKGIFKLRQ